ncbi:hypothetical protein [Lysinibacillus fusiformis]|uniref:hypothetical protein n=1 Tax=Lysinibacillus fusiformis TaxID=28031 RepID=UPI003D05E03B
MGEEMSIVTIIGVSVLGLVTILSAFHGIKAFRGYKSQKSENYLDEAIILEELENEDLRKGEGSFSKVVNSMYSNKSNEEIKNQQSSSSLKTAAATLNKGVQENKEEKYPGSQSSLRSAAITFNKREYDRERNGSTGLWSSNALPSSSSYMDIDDRFDKGTNINTGDLDSRNSVSSTNESVYSSSSKGFSGSNDFGSGGRE